MKMKSKQKSIGNIGERIARKFLQDNGFDIVAQNLWLNRLGEIDFVAKKSGLFHFIEVKTIKQCSEFKPEDHFTQSKRHKLSRLISLYLNSNKLDCDYQLDLIAIELLHTTTSRSVKLRFYQNV